MFSFTVRAMTLKELGEKLMIAGATVATGVDSEVTIGKVARKTPAPEVAADEQVGFPSGADGSTGSGTSGDDGESDSADQGEDGGRSSETVVAEEGAGAGVDARGLAWDARIHSGTKGKNKDGSWKQRRNTDPKLIEQVEKELVAKAKAQQEEEFDEEGATPGQSVQAGSQQATQAAPQAVIPPPPALPSGTMPPPSAPPALAQHAQAATMATAVQPEGKQVYNNLPLPPTGEQKPAHTLESFKDQLIETVGKLTKAGKVDRAYIKQLKGHYKVDELYDLDDAQTEELFNMWVGHGLITKVG